MWRVPWPQGEVGGSVGGIRPDWAATETLSAAWLPPKDSTAPPPPNPPPPPPPPHPSRIPHSLASSSTSFAPLSPPFVPPSRRPAVPATLSVSFSTPPFLLISPPPPPHVRPLLSLPGTHTRARSLAHLRLAHYGHSKRRTEGRRERRRGTKAPEMQPSEQSGCL